MKILLLGAKGMLGRALQAELSGRHSVVALDREELDITDEEKVRQMICKCKPELIINAAAYTNVDGAESEQEIALAVNATGVGNIAQAAKDMGAAMVHYSTDYVFAGTKQAGYREDDPPGPAVNSYGDSKLAGERLLKEINPNFYLIRTAWLYGEGGKNFVDTIIAIGRQQKEIRVVDDHWGSPTYAADLAATTGKLVSGKYGFGIYHLVNAGVTSWYELAVRIFRSLNQEVTVTPIKSTEWPRPAKRPQWSILINGKGPELRPWQNALADYLGAGMMNNE